MAMRLLYNMVLIVIIKYQKYQYKHHMKKIKYRKRNFLLVAGMLLIGVVAFGVSATSFNTAKKNTSKETIESQHLLRKDRETNLKIRLTDFSGVTQIAFPENYLHQFRINLVYPQPQYKQYINGNVIFTYNAEDDPVVNFYIEPQKTGRLKGTLLVGDRSYTISHLVYP